MAMCTPVPYEEVPGGFGYDDDGYGYDGPEYYAADWDDDAEYDDLYAEQEAWLAEQEQQAWEEDAGDDWMAEGYDEWPDESDDDGAEEWYGEDDDEWPDDWDSDEDDGSDDDYY